MYPGTLVGDFRAYPQPAPYYDAAKIEGLTQRIHKLSQQLLSAEYGLALGQGRPEAT